MAVMLPDIDPDTINNEGERMFFAACRTLPDSYTVVYSYRYFTVNPEEEEREADFVILHPHFGFLVVEVKEGDIMYNNRQWYRLKDGKTMLLDKDPLEQARTAMYHIRDQYTEKKGKPFPLIYGFVLAFPQAAKIVGMLPVPENLIFTAKELKDLERSVNNAFMIHKKREIHPDRRAVETLIDRVLSPSFRAEGTLREWVASFKEKARLVLTEEQQRILDETELDARKLFLGSAGSGKTFLAMEKTRRLALRGKKVLLTCFNKFLAQDMIRKMEDFDGMERVTIGHFHDYAVKFLEQWDPHVKVPDDPDELNLFFQKTVPDKILEYSSFLEEKDKFDSIVVDEAQDFHADWIMSLESLLVEQGEFYAFADLNQTLFGDFDMGIYDMLEVSKHRLTRNLRNVDTIHYWTSNFIKDRKFAGIPRLTGGKPVQFRSWRIPEEERHLLRKDLDYIVNQGIPPHRIVILSPNRREKSSLVDVERIGKWKIGDFSYIEDQTVRFATIRSFKGLEADVVLLIGLRPGTPVCTHTDLYVGGTRARFLLYVYHHEDWQDIRGQVG